VYRQHFGLDEPPFSLTPDTQFYVSHASHRQVLSALLLALKHSEGFIKVVGEVGTGKTLLCRLLLEQLEGHCQTVYIPNPYLSPDELKGFLAQEIGVNSADKPAYTLLHDLQQRLIELAAQQRQVVLIVDEAQAMPRETLEALRLLTNLETAKQKLLQVVLVGQPELDDMLERPHLRQLKQRIVFAEYLQAVPRQQIAHYVQVRVQAAGYKGEALFSRAALKLLADESQGIPRLLNVFCHKALMAAYSEGAERVEVVHMRRAIEDTPERRRRGTWRWVLAGSVAILLAVVLFGWWYKNTTTEPTIDAPMPVSAPAPAKPETQPPVPPSVAPIEEPAEQRVKEPSDVSTEELVEERVEGPVEEPAENTVTAPAVQLSVASQEQQALRRAQQLQAEGEVQAAVDVLQTLIDNIDLNQSLLLPTRYRLLQIYLQQDQQAAAEVLVDERLPESTQACLRARLWLHEGRQSDALALLENAAVVQSGDEACRALLAGLYHQQGLYTNAQHHYQRLLERFGEQTRYWLGLALALDAQHSYAAAQVAYQRVLQSQDLSPEVQTFVRQRLAELIN